MIDYKKSNTPPPNDELSLDNPPRGVSIERTYDGTTVITAKRELISLVPGVFCIIFAIIWSNGLLKPIFGIIQAIIKKSRCHVPDWLSKITTEGYFEFADSISDAFGGGWLPLLGMALFFLPFVFAGFTIIGAALFFLFGKCVIRIGNGEGSIFKGVGVFGRTRRFATHSVKFIGVREESDGEGGKSRYLCIEMINGRKLTIVFITEKRTAWLTFALNKLVK